ncbi:CRISP-associated protein Cas1 [Bowdeniella nasicola]|uniref:CRISPR-associated endonuclease Cas1 n=1 Tax=Bowdeniella nasicola TaxID=208480 RepID=A0A1H4CM56_9ACTO|nr:type I-E CRISPR-associated endonuclease Cas1e [Bowdeniella nasicola]SEA61142.1 CRISP-associated protein Cas1 [Bowdeniella nasicola]
MPRLPPVPLQALPRIEDRLTFLYLEHCVVHREDGAVTARNAEGTTYIPAATLSVLMLGPGTSISHQAMVLLAECGTTTVWVGERGVRYYAHGRSLAATSRLAEAQAKAATNKNERLQVARRMYLKRFGGEHVGSLTMQQLRGREGARMSRLYRSLAKQFEVRWDGRSYEADDFDAADPINAAISAANASLYGLVHAVVVGLGCSPGLGIVHSGHARSFVYDIADLYKAEVSLPLAFRLVSEEVPDLLREVRRQMRELMHECRLIPVIVRDIQECLGTNIVADATIVSLWDYQQGAVAGGANWSDPWDT